MRNNNRLGGWATPLTPITITQSSPVPCVGQHQWYYRYLMDACYHIILFVCNVNIQCTTTFNILYHFHPKVFLFTYKDFNKKIIEFSKIWPFSVTMPLIMTFFTGFFSIFLYNHWWIEILCCCVSDLQQRWAIWRRSYYSVVWHYLHIQLPWSLLFGSSDNLKTSLCIKIFLLSEIDLWWIWWHLLICVLWLLWH